MAHIRKPSGLVPEAPQTETLYANRVRVYPMAVHGRMRQIKWVVLGACLGVYYLLPWLRWNRGADVPNQAVLLDLFHRRFYLFGIELWPQEVTYLAGMMIVGAVTLFFVTSIAGRVWCGYTCPQTVWTDLFMLIERWIEGDRNARMKRDAAPMTFDTAWRKVVKHAAWIGIAFWTGGAWIMYFVDAPTVTHDFWTGQASSAVYSFIFLFSLTTYVLAGWAREQVCTYMCPWPRFQSSMMDEHSFTVTYQAQRGEPRQSGRHAVQNGGFGDCIDCSACVSACPTGIDIRDGIQLECIDCGLCMDACNHVMEKVGRKPWLIAWDTLARQAAKRQGRSLPVKLLRPRSLIYITALTAALVTMGTALATRSPLSISIQRDRAPLYVTLPSGEIRNGYTLHVSNMSRLSGAFTLHLADLPGARIAVAETNVAPAKEVMLQVDPDQVASFRVLVSGVPLRLEHGSQPVRFELRNDKTAFATSYNSVFMGPDNPKPEAR